MKKIIFAMVLLMGICFTTASCTKEKSLKGTTWIGTQVTSEWTTNFTLSFFESTYTLDRRDSDGYFATMTGNYTYNDPIVTLFIDGESFSGSVSGDHLLLDGVDFTKRQ
jgi:hypothetical protein